MFISNLHGHLIIVATLCFPYIVALYLCTASESGEWHFGFRNASITSVNWLSDPTSPCSTRKRRELTALGSNPRKQNHSFLIFYRLKYGTKSKFYISTVEISLSVVLTNITLLIFEGPIRKCSENIWKEHVMLHRLLITHRSARHDVLVKKS